MLSKDQWQAEQEQADDEADYMILSEETEYEKSIDVVWLCRFWADRVSTHKYMEMYSMLHGWRMLCKEPLSVIPLEEHWMLMDVLMEMERGAA